MINFQNSHLRKKWSDLFQSWSNCNRCLLHTGRTNVVMYRGDVKCEALFIGEAPGTTEDECGRPFVGPSGKLLDSLISDTLPSNMTFGIANTIGCIPRGISTTVRQPFYSEMDACKDRLLSIIQLVQPLGIILVGRIAQSAFVEFYASHVESMWNRMIESKKFATVQHQPIISHIVHPAFILRKGGRSSATYQTTKIQLDAIAKEIRTRRKEVVGH